MTDEEKKARRRERYAQRKDGINARRRAKYAEDPEPVRKQVYGWRAENPEKVKSSCRKYYYSHREERLEYSHKRYDENRDRIVEQKRTYNAENRELKNEKARERWDQNKDEFNEARREYAHTPIGRADMLTSSYRSMDKKNGRPIDGNFTSDWMVEHIFSSSCVYCGDSDWTHLGADRIDNSKPHTPDNVVCSCGICNAERGDNFTVEEFIEYRKTHPRLAKEKSYEVVNGVTVLKKKTT